MHEVLKPRFSLENAKDKLCLLQIHYSVQTLPSLRDGTKSLVDMQPLMLQLQEGLDPECHSGGWWLAEWPALHASPYVRLMR